jgi:hypothetical protein
MKSHKRATKTKFSAAEMQKRVDLAAAYRLVHLYGMDEMIANHISARVPGKDDVFYINPYGLLYDQMHASCFVELDLDGNVVYNPTEYGINQAGFVLHSAVHKARHDVDCVIHTHTLGRRLRDPHAHPRRHGGVGDEVRAAAARADGDALHRRRLSRLRRRGAQPR